MQALADSNYLFHDIFVGWPGSVCDARVFSNSQLYALGCRGRLFSPDIGEGNSSFYLSSSNLPHVKLAT